MVERTMTDQPIVSVILVNFRGVDDTLAAVRGLRDDVEWPRDRLEIVVVENGSGDDSAVRLAAELGESARLIVSHENLGFAGGCNLGVAASSGEIVAFLNNDARPDREWVAAAIRRFVDPRTGAVACRVLDWEGELVDYIGSAMTWFGMAYKPFTGQPEPARRSSPDQVLFGTGSAMFVRRSVFEELGGFDERYFMFYEDVDLGWRLNLRGHRFVYEPASLAYHRHHASMGGYGSFREHYLLERNALFTLYKNLGDDALGETLSGALALAVRRGVTLAGADSNELDLRRADDEAPTQPTSRDLLASTYAIDRFVEALPGLKESRDRIQATRQVTDSAIREFFGVVDEPIVREPYFLDGYERVVGAFDVLDTTTSASVLIITGDPLGARLAGPAIRAWHIAEALAAHHEVVLVSSEPIGDGLPAANFRVEHVHPGDHAGFAPLLKQARVVVLQGLALEWFPEIGTSDRIVVADVYDPMHLEQLEQARDQPPGIWAEAIATATDVINRQLERADLVLCASERQRTFYLGQLSALGRISAATYADDPYLDKLIAVVPFGLDDEPPRPGAPAIRGVVPGIGPEDRVLIWAGGIYNWFDPLTLVEAVGLLAVDHPELRLYFLGTKHPHPGVPEMRVLLQTRARAEELGLLGRAVFFNEGWVDFAERGRYLLDADLGVSTHMAHLETQFSFRTRILDYLWAGLPMVVTDGDIFAELVEREGLGAVVPAGDPTALAAAIERLLFDPTRLAEARSAVERVRSRFAWPVVLAPLVDFVRVSRPAADHAVGMKPRPRRRLASGGIGRDLDRFAMYLREAGLRAAMSRAVAVIRRRRRR